MTIGELYEIHKELSAMEEKKPKKERFHTGGSFSERRIKTAVPARMKRLRRKRKKRPGRTV